MHTHKLIQNMATLSASELKAFGQLVYAPYFCKDATVHRFFDAIVATDFQADLLKKKKIYMQVFGKAALQPQKLYDLTSTLYQLLEEFIVHQRMKTEQAEKKAMLLDALSERQWNRSFTITYNALTKAAAESALKDDHHYYNRYRHAAAADDLFMRRELREADAFLEEKLEHLDHFYIAAKLKGLCEVYNRSNIITAEVSDKHSGIILQLIEQQQARFQNIDAVWVYYTVFRMLQTNDASYFKELTGFLGKKSASFSKSEARGLFQYALNFCIKRINNGENTYLQHIFEVYQLQITKGLLLEGKYLNQWNYKNIITVGLRLGKFDWTYAFLNDQKENLAPDYRENAFHYNLANYYYTTKRYSEARKLMQVVVFNDAYYNLATRSLLMRTYYEEEDVEALFAQIESFRQFLTRNKQISDYQKEVNLNFLRLTKRNQRLREKKPLSLTEKYAALLDEQQARILSKPTVHRPWLLGELEALRN